MLVALPTNDDAISSDQSQELARQMFVDEYDIKSACWPFWRQARPPGTNGPQDKGDPGSESHLVCCGLEYRSTYDRRTIEQLPKPIIDTDFCEWAGVHCKPMKQKKKFCCENIVPFQVAVQWGTRTDPDRGRGVQCHELKNEENNEVQRDENEEQSTPKTSDPPINSQCPTKSLRNCLK